MTGSCNSRKCVRVRVLEAAESFNDTAGASPGEDALQELPENWGAIREVHWLRQLRPSSARSCLSWTIRGRVRACGGRGMSEGIRDDVREFTDDT